MSHLRTAIAVIVGVCAVGLGAQTIPQKNDAGAWSHHGGDKAFTRYSPLDQITAANVQKLRIVESSAIVAA